MPAAKCVTEVTRGHPSSAYLPPPRHIKISIVSLPALIGSAFWGICADDVPPEKNVLIIVLLLFEYSPIFVYRCDWSQMSIYAAFLHCRIVNCGNL